jgi:LysR family transcriptional regulator, transcriptional activator of nhaA
MNFKHLHYFWKVAKQGSVARAAEALNVTPQTLSGQIALLEERLGAKLFSRQGRSLTLTDAGTMAFEYADEMFTLGNELETMIRHYPQGRPSEFRVGVSDAVPKSLAFRLLQPAVAGAEPVRIVCREWRLERLLAELSVHHLDLVISDRPLPPSLNVRAYNHRLLESGVSFLVPAVLQEAVSAGFPAALAELPLLLPGEDSGVRQALQRWFESQHLRPRIVGEFDDCALMAAFGEAGIGAFPVPTVVEDKFMAPGLSILGRVSQVRASYFAISVERRLSHPNVLAITRSAQRFASGEG